MSDYAKKYSKAYRQGLADARFVVMERRYDGEGDDWQNWELPGAGITLNAVYDTTPDAVNSQGSYVSSQLIGGGTMSLEQAKFLLKVLYWDVDEYKFSDLDKETRHLITHTIAPIEWHKELDAKDPIVMARFKIYGYELPSLPADLEEKDEAFYESYATKE